MKLKWVVKWVRSGGCMNGMFKLYFSLGVKPDNLVLCDIKE